MSCERTLRGDAKKLYEKSKVRYLLTNKLKRIIITVRLIKGT